MPLPILRKIKPLYVYTFTTFFNAGVSFLVFSFLTHCLNADDYGVINLYGAFCMFMTPFLGLGVQVMIGIDYYKLNAEEFRHQFINSMMLPLLSTVFFTVLFFIFHRYIEQLLHVNYFFAVSFPFFAALILVSDIFLVLLRNKGMHFSFALFSIVKNLTEVGATVLFIYTIPMAWKGRLIGSTSALVVGLLMAVYLVYRWRLLSGRIDRARLRENFRIGLPLVPERLAIFVLSYSDRFFIDYFSATKYVGHYSAGAQVSVIVRLVVVTLLVTFQPRILSELAKSVQNYNMLRKINLQFVGACLVCTAGMIAITPVIFHFFIGRDFQAGQYYAFCLTLGMFFSGLQSLFMTYLLFLKKNKQLMYISIVGVCVCCVLNYVNIRSFGPIGATYTSLATYMFMSLLTLYFVGRHYPVRQLFLRGAGAGPQAAPPVPETAGVVDTSLQNETASHTPIPGEVQS